MTNKEIVEMLKLLKENAVKSCNDTAIINVKKGSFDFVMDSAIKALSQEQQSEWERDHEILKAYADGQESMKPCKDAISRQQCIHRHENGNCLVIGGFCTSVTDKYCPNFGAKMAESEDKG